MNTENKIIFFLGPQGCGKGTQAKKLAKKLNIPYFEAGQMLRDEIASGSEQGKYMESFVNKGDLLPDEYMGEFMHKRLMPAIEKSGGFIVDGFPRRIVQADLLDYVSKPTHVILIEISEEESIRRLSARRMCPKDGRIYNLVTDPPKKDNVCDDCGSSLEQRADDTPDSIRRRLNKYHSNTEPIIDRYEKMGVLHRIDGMPNIAEVEKSVSKIFE